MPFSHQILPAFLGLVQSYTAFMTILLNEVIPGEVPQIIMVFASFEQFAFSYQYQKKSFVADRSAFHFSELLGGNILFIEMLE